MHPRERVLGIACLCSERGQEIPEHILKEAELLGIDVSQFQSKQQQQQLRKESVNDTETIICDP